MLSRADDHRSTADELEIFRRAARLVASSIELEPTLRHTIGAFLPALGDFGFFDAVVGERVVRTARAHDDDDTEALIAPTQWIRQERTDVNLCALSSGRVALHGDIDDDWYRSVAVNDGHLELLRRLAFRSMLTVPMHYGGELLGALTLFMGRSGRRHRDADIAFAEDLAALAAPLVASARSRSMLRDADRRKDEFLAMLAHELRNPLAPLANAVALLKRAPADADRVRDLTDLMGRQIRHLTSLVDDLLDVSRVTRGAIPLTLAPVDVGSVIAQAIEQTAPLIESRGHRLSTKMPTPAATVIGDRNRLIQVVVNLLNNAAKYTPEGGHIDIAVESDGVESTIRVADDGLGMEPELIGRVFELFSQGERTLDRAQGGLGIGLSLVKSLVDLHHGRVAIESAGGGRGTTVTVSLPVMPGTSGDAAQVAAGPSSAIARD